MINNDVAKGFVVKIFENGVRKACFGMTFMPVYFLSYSDFVLTLFYHP